MKRFHLHVSVKNLEESIRFYSTLFAEQPAVRRPDYAKWMLEDPRVNFAISTHRQPLGVNHLGFQVDSDEELRSMHAQLQAADSKLIQENEQPCCYARSDKYWVTDPTGIAWETFHTLGSIPVYGKIRRYSSTALPRSPGQTVVVVARPDDSRAEPRQIVTDRAQGSRSRGYLRPYIC
jgi:hypothetical protein